ncbi:MAG: hypothetical protein HFJ12_07165 [Bacilli bacterium]|nr:hypothetical protein [Bacilli bacterium]
MIKRDLSMIALIFFLTRCFFNLYTFNNLYNFLIVSFSTFLIIFFIRKIKKDILSNKVIRLIYLLVISGIFLIILINASWFINTNYFRYNNYVIIGLSLVVISYIIGKDQIKTIGSISEIFLFTFILVSIIASIGLISLIKVHNYTSFVQLQNISINLFPGLLIFIIFYLKDNNIMTGYILGSISCLFDMVLLVGCLGTKLILKYRFPGIAVLKSLNLFHFINHLDKLLSFIYLFEYTITLSFIMFIIINIIKKTKDNI